MDLVSTQSLWWLLGLVPLGLVMRYSLVDRPRIHRVTSDVLRITALGLLILALCRPFMGFTTHDVHVAFILDVSESVDLTEARRAVNTIDQCISQLGPEDSWTLLLAADQIKPMKNTTEAAAELDQWLATLGQSNFRNASKLTEALLSARLCFPSHKAARMVLFSDGRPTHQPVQEALALLEKEGIDLRWHKLGGLQTPEASIESLTPNTQRAFEGERVRMQAKLRSNRNMPGTLALIHKGVVVTRQEVTLKANQENLVTLDVPMLNAGQTHWTAELHTEQDHFAINNQATCTVTVSGKPRVLILHQTPRRMRAFVKAMTEQDFEIDLRGARGLPQDLAALLAFDAVILADIGATDMSLDQMELLKRYVIDFGGGLAMFGSNQSFGLGGYFNTPVEEVLPLTSRYEKKKEQPSVAMALVIDKSGSMQGLPIELARQAAKSTVDLLGRQDHIGVVAFDGQPFVVSPMRSAVESLAIKNAINTLTSGGGTCMYPGLQTAFDMLQRVRAKIKHVIVLSDGRSHPGDFEGLVETMTRAGITVSTIALGDADRELLANLAQIGRGRYYETHDPTNIPQIFTKETMETSRSAVKEDVFSLVQTSDHTLLSGFSDQDFPVVFGYVMTHCKPATQLLLVAHSGDPVLAVSRHGLGAALAYTADVTDKWGAQWLPWNQFGRFWSQALRSIIRRESSEGLHVEQSRDQDHWTLNITRFDRNGSPLAGIDFAAQLMDDQEAVQPIEVHEVGLGRYQIKVPLGKAPTLCLRLQDKDYDKVGVYHFSKPCPAEYRLGAKVPPELKRLPDLDPTHIRQDLPTVKIRKPISYICYLLAIASMLGGLVLRRV